MPDSGPSPKKEAARRAGTALPVPVPTAAPELPAPPVPPPGSDLTARVRAHVLAEGLPAKRSTVVVGVSGRASSVALLHLLHRLAEELTLSLIVVYLQQPDNPDRAAEEAFVKDLASRLQVSFSAAPGDAPTAGGARTARRRASLERIRTLVRASVVATGETRDDIAEQFLAHLLEDADLLAEAVTAPDGIVRPLLPFTHAEVLAFLNAQGIAVHQNPDALALTTVARHVRLLILPLLRRHLPGVPLSTLASAAQLLTDDHLFVRAVARAARPEAGWVTTAGTVTLDHARWAALPAALRRRMLADAAETLAPARPLARTVLLDLDRQGRHLTDGGSTATDGLKIARAGGTLTLLSTLNSGLSTT